MKRMMIAVGLLLIAASLVLSCAGPSDEGSALDNVTVAAPRLEQNALLYVAEARGLFAANGLDVAIVDCPTGVASLDAALQGRADLAELAEFPLLAAIFSGKPVKIVGCNDRFENDYIAVRPGTGVTVVADLAGKRIGLARGTINEFYLGRYLDLNGLSATKVTMIDLKPERFVDALASGDVDAVVAWQPYVDQIERAVPGVMVWPAQNSQQVFGTLVTRDDWLLEHEGDLERLLISLRDAEEFVRQDPEEAKAIIQNRLGYTAAYIDSVWPRHDFALSLSQSLLTALKDEAQWVMHNDPSAQNELPDIRRYLSPATLENVKPESVDIVR